MVMGVCGASKVNNWTVFDSLDLTSQEEEEEQEEEQEKSLLGWTDRGPTKTVTDLDLVSTHYALHSLSSPVH